MAKYRGTSRGEQLTDSPEDACLTDTVDKAIRSPMFAGYLVMLRFFAKVIMEMTVWSESCPCHHHLLADWHDGRQAHSEDRSQHQVWESCPIRKRRAPELA